MIWLAWVGGYLVAVVVTTRTFLSSQYCDEHHLDKVDYWLAAALGALWPLVTAWALGYVLFLCVWMPLITPSALRRDRRAAARQGAVDDALKRAREHGLPFPGEDDRQVSPGLVVSVRRGYGEGRS